MSGKSIIVKQANDIMGLSCGKRIRQDKGRDKWFKLHLKYCPECAAAGDEVVYLMDPRNPNEVIAGPAIGFVNADEGWSIHPNRIPLEHLREIEQSSLN
jgi:hypothetical protein